MQFHFNGRHVPVTGGILLVRRQGRDSVGRGSCRVSPGSERHGHLDLLEHVNLKHRVSIAESSVATCVAYRAKRPCARTASRGGESVNCRCSRRFPTPRFLARMELPGGTGQGDGMHKAEPG